MNGVRSVCRGRRTGLFACRFGRACFQPAGGGRVVGHDAGACGRSGGVPDVLVWDREGCLHAGAGRPTDRFAAFCGQLPSRLAVL